MKLYIKNMVCLRCIIAVREELTNLGLTSCSRCSEGHLEQPSILFRKHLDSGVLYKYLIFTTTLLSPFNSKSKSANTGLVSELW